MEDKKGNREGTRGSEKRDHPLLQIPESTTGQFVRKLSCEHSHSGLTAAVVGIMIRCRLFYGVTKDVFSACIRRASALIHTVMERIDSVVRQKKSPRATSKPRSFTNSLAEKLRP